MASSPSASTVINLRAPAATRDLIDRAAALQAKTRTDFILEASMLRAEEVLLDQVVFHLTPEQEAQLAQILERPSRPVPQLTRLLSQASPWTE